jgi:aerobic-type carbon monoxide dehydrogenase small subunit (CoxS/CutS family)
VSASRTIELRVNGVDRRFDVDPKRRLLDVLRNELRLTGTKYGCGEGQCGACTVLVDGTPVRSCLRRIDSMAGKDITTIEGLADGDRLHPLQEAFITEGALQCGYCTAGMIMSGAALLAGNTAPDDAAIVQAMRGNICRCGTYPRVLRAIRRASGQRQAAPALGKGGRR